MFLHNSLCYTCNKKKKNLLQVVSIWLSQSKDNEVFAASPPPQAVE